MLLRPQSALAMFLSVTSFLFTPAIVRTQPDLTCDRRALDPDSYQLTTLGQASTLLSDQSDFWDAFRVNSHIAKLRQLNFAVYDLADEALARDSRNMMAHSILARQYTILGWDRQAVDAWTKVAENSGVVVWTATLYDVDAKSIFLMAFGRNDVRVYRMGQFTRTIERRLGHAKFPPPTEEAFYEATGGCPGASAAPMAIVPWRDVTEVRSGNWVLWFKLSRPITLVSDLGKVKTLREVKVNLHGETGEVTFLGESWEDASGIGIGPWDYNRRVRDMLLRFAEPNVHIKRSSTGRGAGW